MDELIFKEMIETRRRLHRHPEEGWTEFETTYLVAERLKALGFDRVLTGTDVIKPECVLGRDEKLVQKAIARAIEQGVPAEFIEKIEGYTGCVGVLETGREGPVVALRFDMDALRIEEADTHDHLPMVLGFRSEYPGLMHACGHDAHTAVGLAVARWAAENRDQLCGTVKFVFQPAEEGVRGAWPMVQRGLFDDVDYVLGSHCGGKAGLGEVALVHRGVLASTKFDIRFKGTPSHAGNQPHKGHSALMAACATSMMLVGIPRHGDGTSRVAVGRLVAGEGRNITPVHAYIQAEVRGESAEINEFMCENVEKIVQGNALAYNVEFDIERVGDATTLVRCPEMIEDLRAVAQSLDGINIIDLKSPAGSEDFTWMVKRVVERGGQGAFFRWGCKHNGHHKFHFDLQDTESMPLAFDMFSGYVRRVCGLKA